MKVAPTQKFRAECLNAHWFLGLDDAQGETRGLAEGLQRTTTTHRDRRRTAVIGAFALLRAQSAETKRGRKTPSRNDPIMSRCSAGQDGGPCAIACKLGHARRGPVDGMALNHCRELRKRSETQETPQHTLQWFPVRFQHASNTIRGMLAEVPDKLISNERSVI